MALPLIEEILNKMQNLSKTMQGLQTDVAGWYRVAKINGTGHPASTLLLSISTNYMGSRPSSIVVAITTTYKTAKIAQIVAAYSVLQNLKKVRVQYAEEEEAFYIEVYYDSGGSKNNIYVKNVNILDENIELLVPVLESASYTNTDELTINYN